MYLESVITTYILFNIFTANLFKIYILKYINAMKYIIDLRMSKYKSYKKVA